MTEWQSLDKFKYLKYSTLFSPHMQMNTLTITIIVISFHIFTWKIFHKTQIIMTLSIPDNAKGNAKRYPE